MVDSVTPELRSDIMSRIRAKDTRPEMIVRRMLHKAGYRYRLHVRKLPGTPDLVFPARKKVIFVHGCFWHMHAGCEFARIPKTRVEFWTTKLMANKARDDKNLAALRAAGWDVLTIWECELRQSGLLNVLTQFLECGSQER
ncbi:DNA mismatch endonuclease Vsr [Duganella sp. LX20W]|uniref:Very short patch repair endonuclease n=1 Tax=Rugamonas brunnea TaxID=2758569 RepID=A0A7W2IDP5_9BURK|nr:very short patch repair endonuclease [Rugamonas brunnea]MBA5639791.1 DNA mismatch endonuclease Vsr [Rugamonas brunnea]